MRHAFNVHAAFARCDHGDALAGAIGHSRHVIFFLDVCAIFNQQAAHFLAQGSGLVGNELHAQNLGGKRLDFIERAGELDAAAFAASTGVDLRFDHPNRAA